MIEETGTSGCESSEEVLVMEVSNSHGGMRRSSRDTDVTTSSGKRRRFDSENLENVFQLEYESRRDLDVKFDENVILTAVSGSGTSDHVSSFVCSINDVSSPDLKAERVSETDIFMSSNDGFSGETSSASSVVSLESEEMESFFPSTPKKKKTATTAAANEATSRRQPPAKTPSPAELEEFFSEAEKYEQKRFVEKYNYDIVKDVPMEGRYQWVRLKP